MDAERLALQVRPAGKVDVRGSSANRIARRARPALTAIGDWQRWSGAERGSARSLSARFGQQGSRRQSLQTPTCSQSPTITRL